MRSLLVLALGATVLSGCALHRRPPVVPDPPVGERDATIGEAAMFYGLSLTPIMVVEDSRCPLGVQCIQAGTARVSTSIIHAGITDLRTFSLGVPSPIGDRSVTLTAVCPTPHVRMTVIPRNVVATYTVTPAGAPTPALTPCRPPAAKPKSAIDRLLGRS